MARAVIRYSISGENSNVTGNAVRRALTDRGFVRVGTAGLGADDDDQSNVFAGLREALAILENPPGGGRLDSLWVNLYNPEDNDALDFAENVG